MMAKVGLKCIDPAYLCSIIHTDRLIKMSRQLDNSNPTIFAPSASTASRRKSGKALLWNEDIEQYAEYDEDRYGSTSSPGAESDREDIDAEEVFGELDMFTNDRAQRDHLLTDRPAKEHYRS